MTEKEIPNLFLVLDLDPDARWDPQLLEERIKEKRQEWSSLANRPDKRGQQASQYRASISALRRIATNEAERSRHAAEARARRQEDRAAQLDDFAERLGLLELRGYILEQELQELVREFDGVLSEPQIRKRVTVEIRKDQAPSKPRQEPLDATTASGIADCLTFLDKPTLYAFLDMPMQTDSSVLFARASAKYDGVQRKGSKTPTDTVVSELAGYCMDIFGIDDNKRLRYDETLRRQAFDDLKEKADDAARVSKRLEAAQLEQLLRGAREAGLDLDETLEVLIEHASQRKYAVVVSEPATTALKRLQRCGHCDNLEEPGQKHCTSCGEPLQMECPKCREEAGTDQMACGNCGFPTGNLSWVKILLNDADQARQQRDYESADHYLQQARKAWPVAAVDSVLQAIGEMESEITPGLKDQASLLGQVEDAVKERRFYAVRDELLPRLEKTLPDGSPETGRFRGIADLKIRQAETRLVQTRQMSGRDPEELVLAYQEVVQICSDCREARDMLAKTPPHPPSAAQATPGGDIVHIEWQPSPSRGVRYTVVRKGGSRPVSASDGRQLPSVAGTSRDDTDPEIGIPLFYAVFADREGVFSHTGATISAPVMLLREVSNLASQIDDQKVHLRWQPPENVDSVEVRRSERSYPRSPHEGSQVTVLGTDQAVDTHVQNEQHYYYTVFSLYRGYDGQLVSLPGAQIEAVPQQPPQPVKELRIAASGLSGSRLLQIDWDPPSKGEVIVVRSEKPTGLEFGATIASRELTKYGRVLPTMGNKVQDKIGQIGFYYYLPAVVFQDTAYVGREQEYVSIDDVSELAVQNLGGRLRLQWRWPPNCQEVIVAYKQQDWPKADEAEATTISLTKAQYDLRGHYDIANPTQADRHIVVYTVINHNGQRIVSSGLHKGCRKVVSMRSRITVNYGIIKKSWHRKKRILELSLTGNGTLPAFVLVRKQGGIPLNKADGETILRSEPIPITQEKLSLEIPDCTPQRESFAALFLKEDDMNDFVIILNPDRSKLILD